MRLAILACCLAVIFVELWRRAAGRANAGPVPPPRSEPALRIPSRFVFRFSNVSRQVDVAAVQAEWHQFTMGGDSSIDDAELRRCLEALYAALEFPTPHQVSVVESPDQLPSVRAGCLVPSSPPPDPWRVGGALPDWFVSSGVLIPAWKTYGKSVNEAGYADITVLWQSTRQVWGAAHLGAGSHFRIYLTLDLMRRSGVDLPPLAQACLDFVRCGVWTAMLGEHQVLVCRRPERFHFEAGQLHNSTGPAVEWAGGHHDFFFKSVRMRPDWVLHPERIQAADVLSSFNVEARRCMIDLMGLERFVREARPQVLDSDCDLAGMPRNLLRIDMRRDEAVTVVQVKCPSTGHAYLLRVPPEVTSCKEAVAWTFGLESSQYRPLLEA